MADPPRRHNLDLSVLDVLRGVAALYVVLFHAHSWLSWPDYSAMQSGIGQHVLYVLWNFVNFGHPPVLLFFLISGFCIHYRQARLLGQRAATSSRLLPLDLGTYVWRRFRRLYPPLILALALTAGIDYLGAHINPNYYMGRGPYEPFNTYLVENGHDLWTLLGNLAMQGGLSFHIFGTVLPLWSLSYEFWFYTLYPLLLMLSTHYGPRHMLGLAGFGSAIALVIAQLVGTANWAWAPTVVAYWVIWAAGAFIAEAYVGRVKVPRVWRAAVPLAALVIVFTCYNVLHQLIDVSEPVRDLLWSTGFAVLLAWILLDCPNPLLHSLPRMCRLLRPLGTISYSLYLVHMPWMFLVAAWWLRTHPTLPAGGELMPVGVVGALALGTACWLLVERHFIRDVRSRSLTRATQAASELRNAQVAGVGPK
jgi:peptidoglycan/LPS O-acetylase OafA/YrhL